MNLTEPTQEQRHWHRGRVAAVLLAGLGVWLAIYALSPARAKIVEAAGEVYVGETPLGEGDSVGSGDELRTAKGRAVVRLADGSVVRIYPQTEARLGRRRIELAVGKLWAQVVPRRQSFEVHTNNAVAGVRGTEFVVEAQADKTSVGVIDGEVEVRQAAARDGGVVLRKDQQSRVRGSGRPSEPKSFNGARESRLWDELTRAIRSVGREVKDATRELAPKVKSKARDAGRKIRDVFK